MHRELCKQTPLTSFLPEHHFHPGLENVPAELRLVGHLDLERLRRDAVQHQVGLLPGLSHVARVQDLKGVVVGRLHRFDALLQRVHRGVQGLQQLLQGAKLTFWKNKMENIPLLSFRSKWLSG